MRYGIKIPLQDRGLVVSSKPVAGHIPKVIWIVERLSLAASFVFPNRDETKVDMSNKDNNSQTKDKFPTFRRIFPFFFFERCSSKDEVKKVKIIYLVIFIALIVIPFLLLSGYTSLYEEELYSPYPSLYREQVIEAREALVGILTFFAKIFLAYITIWVGSKFGMRTGWIVLFAIMAILPLLVWISFIIILTKKPSVETTT